MSKDDLEVVPRERGDGGHSAALEYFLYVPRASQPMSTIFPAGAGVGFVLRSIPRALEPSRFLVPIVYEPASQTNSSEDISSPLHWI